MSNCNSCQTWVCVSGESYLANLVINSDGQITGGTYTDTNFVLKTLNSGTFTFGTCVPVPANSAENEIIAGTGVPSVPPADPTENKLRFNTATGRVDYFWNSATLAWVPFATAFTGLNLAANTGATQSLLTGDTITILSDAVNGVLDTTVTGTDTVRLALAPRVASNTGATLAATDYVVAADGKYHLVGPKVQPFEVIQNLPAGNTVITHSLNLTAPFAQIVQAFDNATGTLISLRVLARTATTTTVNTSVALTGVRITIAG